MKYFSVVLMLLLGLTGCDAAVSAEQPAAEPLQQSAQEPIAANPPTEDGAPRILVAYFSATGHTQTLAQYAAEVLDADLYEIVPQEPYTAEDLNYNDSSSRTSQEMNDSDSRPAINGQVEEMGQYEVVLLAYPIWHGQAPRIMSNFVENYDFADKTVIPFCTSGSSGIGTSADVLQALTESSAKWLPGQRFSGNKGEAEMKEWLDGLNLTAVPMV